MDLGYGYLPFGSCGISFLQGVIVVDGGVCRVHPRVSCFSWLPVTSIQRQQRGFADKGRLGGAPNMVEPGGFGIVLKQKVAYILWISTGGMATDSYVLVIEAFVTCTRPILRRTWSDLERTSFARGFVQTLKGELLVKPWGDFPTSTGEISQL